MTVKSPAQSAFFNPRALIGLGFSAVGLLLALLGLFAFPSSALAIDACSDVVFYEYQEDYSHHYVQMLSDSGCTIYYTVSSIWYPDDPTHSSAIYNPTNNPSYKGLGIPRGSYMFYKAFAHKTGASPEDTGISWYEADNSGN